MRQFTGFYDKEGNKIYEGDIIKDNVGGIGVIVREGDDWGIASYCYEFDGINSWINVDYILPGKVKELTVIGNIHGNHEILNE